MFEFAILAQILWTSLATTSYLVLFAVAFALVLKVNGIFNFTQAAVMTVAFYAAFACVQLAGLSGWIAFPASIGAALGLSWLIETFGFAVLRRKRVSSLFVFIFTFIVSQFVAYLAALVLLLAVLIAGALAALGMFLFGTRTQVQPRTTMELMLFAAVASIIGGVGNLWGAALAAICLGVIQNASILVIPSPWQSFLLYVFLFITIIFFPRGLRMPERVRVGGLATRQLPGAADGEPAAAARSGE